MNRFISSTFCSFKSLLASKNLISIFLLLVLTGLFVVTGLIGINFGDHWDEFVHYDHVMDTLKSGIILPYKCTSDYCYSYPSFTYLLSLISVSTNFIWHSLIDKTINIANIGLLQNLTLGEFRLATRPFFLVLCCCSGLWLYLALVKTSKVAALAAAAVQLLSWEFAYHSRWVAPDAVVAQFFALWILALVMAEDPERRFRWLIFASVIAGFATSTKYTAGALLFATIFYTWLIGSPSLRSVRITNFPVKAGLILAIAFTLAFILITPGSVLQPFKFLSDVNTEMHHYAQGHGHLYGVAPYNVTGGWATYTLRLWEYVSLALISHISLISVLLTIISVVGLISLFRNGKQAFAVTIVAILVFYTTYFSSNCVVFIVRNFLFFLPPLAFLIGNGFGVLIRFSTLTRVMAIVLLAVVVAVHSENLVTSAYSIVHNDDAKLNSLLVQYIKEHPGDKFAVSGRLKTDIGNIPFTNLVTVQTADIFAYHDSDIFRYKNAIKLNEYPATKHATFKWLGPREVNYNYYPGWNGQDRILLLPIKEAKRMGLIDAISDLP